VRLLLDTHVLLWQLDDRKLSAAATEAIDAATELLFSVVSFAEIGIKIAVGKLADRREVYDDLLAEGGIRTLGLTPEQGLAVADLPLHHRDPFDRLLISQARNEGLTIVTADRNFAPYDVPVIPAG
jgi:PIN domain nuclease of toxin-antitoxin system